MYLKIKDKNGIKRVLAFFLMLFIFTGSFQTCDLTAKAENKSSESFYPHKEHQELGENGLKYTGYDFTEINGLLTFFAGIKSKKSYSDEEISEKVDRFIKLSDDMYTQKSLLELLCYDDVTNADNQAKLQKYNDNVNEVSTKTDKALSKLAASHYGSILKKAVGKDTYKYYLNKNEEEGSSSGSELTKKDKKYLKLSSEEQKIVSEYQTAANQDYEIKDEGVKWTMSEFNSNPPADYEEHDRIEAKLLKKENAVLVPYLIKLIDVRNKIADIYGYDNYAEYADYEEYGRDFTKDEREDLYASVKKYMAPLYYDSYRYDYKHGNYSSASYSYKAPKAEEITGIIRPAINDVSPRLDEAFDYLCRNHAYDMDKSSTKSSQGYTQDLYTYGSAFIYNSPSGDMSDVKTMVHEFGHYNAAYHGVYNSINAGSDMDVAEIQSQGLEVLVALRAEKMFEKKYNGSKKYDPEKLGLSYRFTTFQDMLSSVITGCYFDELQFYLYEHPDMNIKSINKYATKLASEYKLPVFTADNTYYDWCEVGHTFDSPMYYISYATSALGALGIASQAVSNTKGDVFDTLKDKDRRDEILDGQGYKKAVKTYLNISKEVGNNSFREVMKKNNLGNIFSGDTIRSISYNVEDIMLPEKARTKKGFLNFIISL